MMICLKARMRNLAWYAVLVVGIILSGSVAFAQEVASPTPAEHVVTPKPDYTAPLNEARMLLGAGDYVGADRALRTLLTTAPELADAHFLLGAALLYEHKFADSLTEYTQGAKFHDPGPQELLGVSLDYIQLKDLPDAEHWLAATVKRAPERPLGWYLLGKVQYEQGHGEDAAHSLLACLRVDPHRLEAEYELGRVYELLKQPEAAATAYRTAIAWQEGAPVKVPGPYLALGMLLRGQGKVAEAVPLLETAARGGAHDPLAYQELGLAYEQLGRYNDAAGELKAAIALDPKNEALHFFLGRVDRKGGQRAEAAREFALAADYAAKQGETALPKP